MVVMEQNKETKVEEQKEKKLHIQMRTYVNGYGLDIDNEGYMYRDIPTLLEGFLVHVGMGRVGEMTKEEIKKILKAFRDGSAAKVLQEEVNQLRAENEKLSKQVRNLKLENKKYKNQKFY